jgi:hypothetical protein
MSLRFLLSVATTVALLGSSATLDAAPPNAVVSVNGHGLWARDTGDVYANHQPYLESAMVNAWLGADGQAQGTIVWMTLFNGLFGAQGGDHGEGISGYAWQVEVDTVIVRSPGEVFVEGVITHSDLEGDVGFRNGFFIYDAGGGKGAGVGADAICPTIHFDHEDSEFVPDYSPVVAGNFRIR